MQIGILPPGEPGVFRSLLLPEAAEALAAGEPVTAFGLTQDRLAVGALAGYLEKGRFQIASLYVAPDYRRCGGGRMLLEALLKALEGYASGVEINLTVTHEEHETLPAFLEVLGFAQEEEGGEGRYLTTLGEVSKRPFFAGSGKPMGTPFSELSEGTLSLMKKAAMMADALQPEGGLSAQTVERDLSVAYLNGSKPEAFMVFDTSWPGGLTLAAVWSGSKDPAILPALLRSAVARARAKYPPETKVMVQAVTGVSAALTQTLLPESGAISYTYYRPLHLWK